MVTSHPSERVQSRRLERSELLIGAAAKRGVRFLRSAKENEIKRNQKNDALPIRSLLGVRPFGWLRLVQQRFFLDGRNE